MSRKFLTPTGLLSAATDPAGSVGAIYYNTVDQVVKVYNGSSWEHIAANSSLIILDGGNSSTQYAETYDGGNASGN